MTHSPLFDISHDLATLKGQATSALKSYADDDMGQHAQDWRERLAALERAEAAWDRFMRDEMARYGQG